MKERLKILIKGAVQGVGFRPFVYRIASELKLTGWVSNSAQGVQIEVEGDRPVLEQFALRVEKEKPEQSFIQSFEPSYLDTVGYKDFDVRESSGGEKTTLILPDIATCPQCQKEISDPSNRRYRYPFTNCTHCGPRYSIIKKIPYDRANTTMNKFKMCEECKREYEDPKDRRFHAQPNACPKCGPTIELWDKDGKMLSKDDLALKQMAQLLCDGRIVAVKGLGGFHIMADARRDEVVFDLRARKHREAKPFALMYPSLEAVKKDCEISDKEERLLLSLESPIVLLKRKGKDSLAGNIAESNPYLGVMLPYTPLHILIMQELDFPVIATSGNLSQEPICIDEKEAVERLGAIVDIFLVHNRPIARHVDDSIVRIMAGREAVLRRSRGYAPLPVQIPKVENEIIAVGGHLKNTIGIAKENNCFISQHIGDLETEKSFSSFERTINDLSDMYECKPEVIAHDLHPNYMSTKFAKNKDTKTVPVQHHYAHVLSCMAENEIDDEVLGVSWDGTGYGVDQTIWGGEFLKVTPQGFERFAHFDLFPLPGGEVAIREPRRSALGLLYRIYKDDVFSMKDLVSLKSFTAEELNGLKHMLEKNINCPLTSSVGRRFDAVSSLLNICHRIQFEGQAAMGVEFAVDENDNGQTYSSNIIPGDGNNSIVIKGPSMEEIIEDIRKDVSVGLVASKFHNTLAEIILSVAKESGFERIVLTGGCFQNKILTERTVRKLHEGKFKPYWHQRVPPNDGGIALGQIVAAQRMLKK